MAFVTITVRDVVYATRKGLLKIPEPNASLGYLFLSNLVFAIIRLHNINNTPLSKKETLPDQPTFLSNKLF